MSKRFARLKRLSPPKVLFLGFFAIIFSGSLLLSLPIAHQPGVDVTYIDALFTATSAVCVTGLVVVDTGTTYSSFGHGIILLLIQLGGISFMTFSTLFAIALRRKISYRERQLLQEALNQDTSEGIIRLIQRVMIYTFVIQAIGALLMTSAWAGQLGAGQALWYAVFHSVSAFNNAGFDLFGSLTGPYSSFTGMVDNAFINMVTSILVILGGLGFFVLSDLIDWRIRRRLTLHSRVVLLTSGLLAAVGTLTILLIEFNNARTLGQLHFFDKLLAAFFQSTVSRTAGINTLDISSLMPAAQFLLIMLMFIGGAPGSTAGGIKVTSFATMIAAVISMMRGREEVIMLRHLIPRNRVYKAITITFLSLSSILVLAIILSVVESKQPFFTVLFETTSAFATVGLSLGMTPEMSNAGKLIISLTMFIGRLGPLTLMYMIAPDRGSIRKIYPDGKIII